MILPTWMTSPSHQTFTINQAREKHTHIKHKIARDQGDALVLFERSEQYYVKRNSKDFVPGVVKSIR